MTNGAESAPEQDEWPPAVSPATTPSPDAIPAPAAGAGADAATGFAGRRSPVFWLALRTGLLTVLTLGVYRFWMKTRLRRWYWSAIRPGGHPLEYTGEPLEKLLGFLIAVVILAFYLGIVNLLLMFASFSLFQGNSWAYGASVAGVLPLWFYAQYRARRYVLARTRWRGLRFGLEPGAWSYAARALWHWALTILTLGVLWPRMTFWLEKYKADRTWYGDQRLEQGGRWQMLYPATRWIIVSAFVIAAGAFGIRAGNPALGTGIVICGGLLGLYGIAHYRVRTHVLLAETKRLGDTGLRLTASPFRILMIHVLGYWFAALGVVVVLIPLILVAIVPLVAGLGGAFETAGVATIDFSGLDVGRWVLIALSVASYFTVFLVWSALTHALVTLPTVRHYAFGLGIVNEAALFGARQRPGDTAEQAEGFAEALDVGASL